MFGICWIFQVRCRMQMRWREKDCVLECRPGSSSWAHRHYFCPCSQRGERPETKKCAKQETFYFHVHSTAHEYVLGSFQARRNLKTRSVCECARAKSRAHQQKQNIKMNCDAKWVLSRVHFSVAFSASWQAPSTEHSFFIDKCIVVV